ncbi:MAG TPA: hypothetical protein GX505_02890 [Clostridiales bacterium]|nr:hypothetical protein [Clostridiales bacterium]
MKKSLLVVVVLLCVASMMAAMAYTTAHVKSMTTVKLTNTDEALLALVANPAHQASGYHAVTARILKLDLNKGFEGKKFGIQPFSVYSWNELFKVKNNSENKVEVTITIDGNCGITDIDARVSGTTAWTRLYNRVSGKQDALKFVLGPNEEIY